MSKLHVKFDSLYSNPYYPRFQPSAVGLGTYPLQIKKSLDVDIIFFLLVFYFLPANSFEVFVFSISSYLLWLFTRLCLLCLFTRLVACFKVERSSRICSLPFNLGEQRVTIIFDWQRTIILQPWKTSLGRVPDENAAESMRW